VKPYYEHAGITIYHGDCREVLRELKSADLVVTDPPYGIFLKGGKWGKKFGNGLDWDKQPAGNIEQVLEAGVEQIIWGGNYFSLPPSRGWLIWYKPDSVPSAADVELAWTSRDMNSKLITHSIAATNGERVAHPTQKPLAVMKWCIAFFPEAQTILDPFAGSGTTLRAAKDLGRCAIGIEIEEKYCEIAAKRLSQEVFTF
jgi:site-specific DNA-methyltransferase (adenine-specific)